MHPEKLKRLEAKGWAVGSADEFLELSEEESILVDLKLKLSRAVKEQREKKKLTQSQLAEHIHSSQSRVAKIEANDPSVSMDLTLRALVFAGASFEDIADAICHDSSDCQQKDLQTV